jgi:hypothetical protein
LCKHETSEDADLLAGVREIVRDVSTIKVRETPSWPRRWANFSLP